MITFPSSKTMSTFISSPPFFLNGRGSEVDSGYASSLKKVVTYVATKTVLGLYVILL